MQTFPLYRRYTPQRKLLPESCAELRNLVRISVTIKVCCLPPQKYQKLQWIHSCQYVQTTVTGRYSSCTEVLSNSSEQWKSSAMKQENCTHLLSLGAKINIRLPEANPCPSEASKCVLVMEIRSGFQCRFYFQIYFKKDLLCEKLSWPIQADLQFSVSTEPSGKLFLKSWCSTFSVAWVLCCFGTTWSWRWRPSSSGESRHKQTSWSLLKVFLQLQSSLLLQAGHLLHQFSSGLLLLHKTTSA